MKIGHDREAQKVVIPANAGIQYAAAPVILPRRLWNTGSPAFAGDDSLGVATASHTMRLFTPPA